MELFWSSDRHWARIEPLLPKVHTRPDHASWSTLHGAAGLSDDGLNV